VRVFEGLTSGLVSRFISNDTHMSFHLLEHRMEVLDCAVKNLLADGDQEWSMFVLGECVWVS
jgi:hypothetical protein